jgi:hypothetical protein
MVRQDSAVSAPTIGMATCGYYTSWCAAAGTWRRPPCCSPTIEQGEGRRSKTRSQQLPRTVGLQETPRSRHVSSIRRQGVRGRDATGCSHVRRRPESSRRRPESCNHCPETSRCHLESGRLSLDSPFPRPLDFRSAAAVALSPVLPPILLPSCAAASFSKLISLLQRSRRVIASTRLLAQLGSVPPRFPSATTSFRSFFSLH